MSTAPAVELTDYQKKLLFAQQQQSQTQKQPLKISVQKCNHDLSDELNTTLRLRDVDAEGNRTIQCLICKASIVAPPSITNEQIRQQIERVKQLNSSPNFDEDATDDAEQQQEEEQTTNT